MIYEITQYFVHFWFAVNLQFGFPLAKEQKQLQQQQQKTKKNYEKWLKKKILTIC